MAKIKEEDIDLLRERADIVEIVSAYTHLKKSGGHTFKGLCPIHSEKTPSFTVDTARGLAHCFGCGWGGNVYQFIQEKENLPFPDAVEWLARKVGYNLRYEDETPGDRKAKGLRMRILEANRIATELFHKTLMDSPAATEARTYLGRRGFDREVAARWQLGYSPGRDALCKLLLSKGFTKDEIVAADLGRISDRDGALYDSFRQRVMFPTWDLQNEVVAFGARALGDQQPKYLNTSETPAFSKSRFMYGLNRAKSAISRDAAAIVVEGYTDVIALHEAGITEAVATNGTALGESHLTLLRKFTERVVLVFDADEAGAGAAMRGFGDVKDPLFRQVGMDILVATVPSGRDPADLVREDGADAMQKVIEAAAPIWDAKLDQTILSIPIDTPEARSRAVAAAVEVLRSHPDPIARHEYAFTVAQRIGVDEEVVQRALSEMRSGLSERAGTSSSGEKRYPGNVKVEREALRLLLILGARVVDAAADLDDSVFTAPPRRELFNEAVAAARDGLPTSRVASNLSPEALSLYTELSVGASVEAPTEAEVKEVFMRLKVFRLEREIKKRRATLQEVNPLDDAKRHDDLFTELVGLEAQRRDLMRSIQGAA
jgi:DNA primase